MCARVHTIIRIELESETPGKGDSYMTVDMLLSSDESRNDRMLRAELRNNDTLQAELLERRLCAPDRDCPAGTFVDLTMN